MEKKKKKKKKKNSSYVHQLNPFYKLFQVHVRVLPSASFTKKIKKHFEHWMQLKFTNLSNILISQQTHPSYLKII